ncbi:MAG: hypothetical protein IPP71_14530 [Bacteroidetes bacterium]|nr:hypothetical protein [Bacteroidota bacterium]
MEKNCLTCQSKLTGRSDKKFCNDACRNEYHNQLIRNRGGGSEKKVADTIMQNRKILSGLYANGVRQLAKTDLECYGFDFQGITGLEFLEKGKMLLFCFEFNLVKNGGWFKIEKGPLPA